MVITAVVYSVVSVVFHEFLGKSIVIVAASQKHSTKYLVMHTCFTSILALSASSWQTRNTSSAASLSRAAANTASPRAARAADARSSASFALHRPPSTVNDQVVPPRRDSEEKK